MWNKKFLHRALSRCSFYGWSFNFKHISQQCKHVLLTHSVPGLFVEHAVFMVYCRSDKYVTRLTVIKVNLGLVHINITIRPVLHVDSSVTIDSQTACYFQKPLA